MAEGENSTGIFYNIVTRIQRDYGEEGKTKN